MPASPWKSLQPADPRREYLVLLSFLPLKRLWRIPWFGLQANRITKQLERSAGVIGYSVNSRLFTRRFWTLSAWEDEAALQAFVHAAPHVATMRAMIPHMGPTRFVRWTVLGAHLPVRWDDALRR
jgi:heme-degrading monooxygenase HmoA